MVTHCLCHDRSFAELKRLSGGAGGAVDLETLKARTGCCTGCRMCEPYVRLMLATGRTEFAVLDAVECARIMGVGVGAGDEAGSGQAKPAQEQ